MYLIAEPENERKKITACPGAQASRLRVRTIASGTLASLKGSRLSACVFSHTQA